THRPMIKDPMVVEEDGTPETTTPPLSKKIAETKIMPPSQAAVPDEPPAQEPEKPESEDMPAETEEPEPEDKSHESSHRDKNDESATAAQEAKLQKLIDSKKYFLPINAVEQRRSKRVVTLGVVLAILLALAWFNIALDAGLIHVDNIKPVTHFFSN
ncbi:MAG TPA: hypothetical protein VD706_01595, partial [Candidatus Saccharimonadales bacterium]|nr:hypothetical protein [Candidatus Saccharimonadales bacterium]